MKSSKNKSKIEKNSYKSFMKIYSNKKNKPHNRC